MNEQKKSTNEKKKNSAKPKKNVNRNTSSKKVNSEKRKNTSGRADFKALSKKKNPVRKEKAGTGKKHNTAPLKIIPLGGLGEIGKNMTLYSYGDDMFIVDCGMSFPDEETPGIDIVIPDFTYVLANKDKIKGLVLTHGHEDHIGAIPYLLKDFNLPIYGTALTLGIVDGKLKEHGLSASAKLNVVSPGQSITLGVFKIEFIHVNHSIPDSVALAITSPAGTVIQTGDFKIDTTPIDGKVIDLPRFAEYGKKGVLALLSDSTNAERPGYTPSERIVGESFSNLFKKAENNRIIVATFSSNIHRIQQIIDEAAKCGRKVAISGRSMLNVVSVASQLGYLKLPDNILIDISELKNYTPDKLVVVTTGSQGEPLSALHRIAFSEHRQVELIPGDMIIISATPIPGNEKTVGKVVNELLRRGANVVYEKMYDVHVSGHACQDEIKLLMSVVNPKYFIPVHGEEKHLRKNASLAFGLGIDEKHTVIAEIGDVIELSAKSLKITGQVPAGRMLVDGLGIGDVGSIVLRDRKHLADDGIIVVTVVMDSATGEVISGPEVVSRGFVYVRESEELMNELNSFVCDVLEKCYMANIRDWGAIKGKLRDATSKFLYEKTRKSPIILPIIMEV